MPWCLAVCGAAVAVAVVVAQGAVKENMATQRDQLAAATSRTRRVQLRQAQSHRRTSRRQPRILHASGALMTLTCSMVGGVAGVGGRLWVCCAPPPCGTYRRAQADGAPVDAGGQGRAHADPEAQAGHHPGSQRSGAWPRCWRRGVWHIRAARTQCADMHDACSGPLRATNSIVARHLSPCRSAATAPRCPSTSSVTVPSGGYADPREHIAPACASSPNRLPVIVSRCVTHRARTLDPGRCLHRRRRRPSLRRPSSTTPRRGDAGGVRTRRRRCRRGTLVARRGRALVAVAWGEPGWERRRRCYSG